MKKILFILISILLVITSYSQVTYIQREPNYKINEVNISEISNLFIEVKKYEADEPNKYNGKWFMKYGETHIDLKQSSFYSHDKKIEVTQNIHLIEILYESGYDLYKLSSGGFGTERYANSKGVVSYYIFKKR